MQADEMIERAKEIAERIAVGCGEEIRGEIFCKTYSKIIYRLMRAKPIIAILLRSGEAKLVGPMVQRGFRMIVREEDPELIKSVEERYGKSTEKGTVLMPMGFDGYEEQLKEAGRYKKVLSSSGGIITIQCHGEEEDQVALYIP